MHAVTFALIIAVVFCYISPSMGGKDCTVDGTKVAPGWKSDDGCRSCKCRNGNCKLKITKKAKCAAARETTTTLPETTTTLPEVTFVNNFTRHNEADEPEENETFPIPPGRSGYILQSVCPIVSGYEITTLTSADYHANSHDNFMIRIYAGRKWTVYYVLNNPGSDRQRKHWDRYGPFLALNMAPVDYIQVMHVSGTDGWKIFTIFVRHTCTNEIYEFKCGSCWVDRPWTPHLYIKRTN